ncbi:uncharacterized protein LOC143879580 [Tasmannia lanceolata]|uniref:uncharacterized protein LOC143879580 n=1 Tax=Tasmannia lanceolata TaxID=3420 RepID=UPI0040630DEE
MLKKLKRVSMPSYPVDEEAKNRFKHQILMQDFIDLQKKTEATKTNLKRAKQKKVNLLAEVRFLRRRYTYLLNNPPQNFAPEHPLPPRIPVKPSQKIAPEHPLPSRIGIKPSQKIAPGHPLPPRIPLKPSQKIAPGQPLLPRIAINPSQKIASGHPLRPRIPVKPSQKIVPEHPLPHRNPANRSKSSVKEQYYGEKETSIRSPSTVLDLNQISVPDLQNGEETEEFQVVWEPIKMEENLKRCSMEGDTLESDLKSSIFRDLGNGSKRTGKRKISWQDPVALRV